MSTGSESSGWRIWVLMCLLGACSLVLAGCYRGATEGAEAEDGPGNTPDRAPMAGPGTCVDTEKYFEQAVWRPILEAKCMACHNNNGAAKGTDLVLLDSDYPGYLEANYNTVQNIARLEIDGDPLLLLKPTAQVEHGGQRVLDPAGEEVAVLAEMIERFDAPVHCEIDKDTEAFYAGIGLLDERETLRKAVFLLASRLPTKGELALVEEDGMLGLDIVLEAVLEEEEFYVRLREIWNDVLHTDAYLPGSEAVDTVDEERFPNAFWYETLPDDQIETAMSLTNLAIAREPLAIIEWVVRNDRPFSEILIGDYTIVNPYSARSYDVPLDLFADPNDPEEVIAYSFEDIPQAGVLTTPVFLNRYPTTATNRNRHRSRMVFQFFMATDVMRLAARPIDVSSIADHNPTLYNPACNVCHDYVDPLAGAFMNWDELGRYRPPEAGWFGDMRPPGFADLQIPYEENGQALRWLTAELVRDPKFSLSVVHTMYRGLTGQDPLAEPIDADRPDYVQRIRAFEAQDYVFKKIAAAFADSDFDLRVVIKELVKTHWFRAVTSERVDAARNSELQDMGTALLLPPEALHRRIVATTGYPWRRDGTDVLLSGSVYKFFYGGIDSASVTTRLTQMNGVMANIADRMSNEVSCAVTALDFAKPAEERLLFPLVEIDDTPELGAETAVRNNIQHLHDHLLGEQLSLDDPEVDRTYAVFAGILKDGRDGILAGDDSTTLPGQCQALVDPITGEAVAVPIVEDPDYTVRAWMAVVAYLLGDFEYLYE